MDNVEHIRGLNDGIFDGVEHILVKSMGWWVVSSIFRSKQLNNGMVGGVEHILV